MMSFCSESTFGYLFVASEFDDVVLPLFCSVGFAYDEPSSEAFCWCLGFGYVVMISGF